MEIKTRTGLAEALEGMGMSYETSQEVLGLTAPVRHESRKSDVFSACNTGANNMVFASGSHPDATEAEVLRVGLCVFDMFGIGGGRGLTGEATDRIPQFRNLGKGRKQAYDGPAWSAAIKEAATEMFDQIKGSNTWKGGEALALAPVHPEGGDPCPGWTGVGIALTPDGGEILPMRGNELRPWAAVVATLGAADRAIAALPSEEMFGGMYSREIRDRPNWPVLSGRRIKFVGTPSDWSQVIDALNMEM
jgi:hypothetical protein